MHENGVSINDLIATLDNISDGIVIVKADGEIKWSNNAFRALANTVGCNLCHSLFEVFGFANITGMESQVTEVFQTKVSCQKEVFFKNINQWYLLCIRPTQDGVVIRFQEITTQKEDNNDVLIDERNLRILVNITDHPIWLVDTECNIHLCNDAFKKWIFTFSGRELGKGDNVLAGDLDSTYLRKLNSCYELALTGKHFTAIEDMKVGGEVKFTTINFNPVFDRNGVLSAISCYASDITDHRRNLSKIEAQTQLLMEIANIQSHKVRGPVATLLGLVHIFNFEDPSDPGNLEIMNGVAEVTGKLDEIVKDVIRSINLLSFRTLKSNEIR